MSNDPHSTLLFPVYTLLFLLCIPILILFGIVLRLLHVLRNRPDSCMGYCRNCPQCLDADDHDDDEDDPAEGEPIYQSKELPTETATYYRDGKLLVIHAALWPFGGGVDLRFEREDSGGESVAVDWEQLEVVAKLAAQLQAREAVARSNNMLDQPDHGFAAPKQGHPTPSTKPV